MLLLQITDFEGLLYVERTRLRIKSRVLIENYHFLHFAIDRDISFDGRLGGQGVALCGGIDKKNLKFNGYLIGTDQLWNRLP